MATVTEKVQKHLNEIPQAAPTEERFLNELPPTMWRRCSMVVMPLERELIYSSCTVEHL